MGCRRRGDGPQYCIVYFGASRPSFRDLQLPQGIRFTVERIDTWEMTVTPLDGYYEGTCRIALPGKPYQALRIKRAQ
ncbi:DUF5605 domain-containing protein [Paenibacillus konkukensis]|uniref:DUF5605 domain-containing protein n=1 Tax=Paenibacillus konkukensis TaxID=2020716 RepID=UPI0032E3BA0F